MIHHKKVAKEISLATFLLKVVY